jgi:hypothetical protein
LKKTPGEPEGYDDATSIRHREWNAMKITPAVDPARLIEALRAQLQAAASPPTQSAPPSGSAPPTPQAAAAAAIQSAQAALEAAAQTLLADPALPPVAPGGDSVALSNLRAAARQWLASPQASVRLDGVLLGLWAGDPAAIGPALDLLAAGALDHNAAMLARQLALTGGRLDSAQFQRVIDLLRARPDPLTLQPLLELFRQPSAPPAADAGLAQLARAAEPWLWVGALRPPAPPIPGLPVAAPSAGFPVAASPPGAPPNTPEKNQTSLPAVVLRRLATTGSLDAALPLPGVAAPRPGSILQRLTGGGPIDDGLLPRLIALGLAAAESPSAPPAEAARAILRELLAPALLHFAPDAFAFAAGRVARGLPPADATQALVRFLVRQIEAWPAAPPAGRPDPTPQGVERVVRWINALNGLNLGFVGDGPDRLMPHGWAYDWRGVAGGTVQWYEDRRNPVLVPVGWSPPAAAVRLVWLNADAPELSVIGLWDPALEPGAQPPFHSMSLAGDFLNYRIVPGGAGGTRRIEMRAGVMRGRGIARQADFHPASLPLDLTGILLETDEATGRRNAVWQSRWEVHLEPAAAAESALAGTRLLAEWRRETLGGGSADGAPRVRAMHEEGAVLEFVLARREMAGWPSAEIALRAAMDRDPVEAAPDIAELRPTPDREESLAAWDAFLAREDLPPEMRVHALLRYGLIAGLDHGAEGDGESIEDCARARQALALARAIDPEWVGRDTILATLAWGALPGPPAEATRRAGEALDWLDTRTDAMIARGALRPVVGNWGLRPWRAPLAMEAAARQENIRGLLDRARSLAAAVLERRTAKISESGTQEIRKRPE